MKTFVRRFTTTFQLEVVPPILTVKQLLRSLFTFDLYGHFHATIHGGFLSAEVVVFGFGISFNAELTRGYGRFAPLVGSVSVGFHVLGFGVYLDGSIKAADNSIYDIDEDWDAVPVTYRDDSPLRSETRQP